MEPFVCGRVFILWTIFDRDGNFEHIFFIFWFFKIVHVLVFINEVSIQLIVIMDMRLSYFLLPISSYNFHCASDSELGLTHVCAHRSIKRVVEK